MPSTQQLYIRGTGGDPAVRAQAALAERGDDMLAELSAKVALAAEYELSSANREELQDRLVEFCTDRVLHYLLVVDRVVYAAAAGATKTRLLVRGLRAQHQLIARYVEDLDRAGSHEALDAAAHSVVAALTACHEVERTTLLPALATLPGVDLPTLIDDVVTLLDGGTLERPEVLDVREIPHGRRHPRIFGLYARLAPGESFVLVNNHDPQPLRREFDATYPHQFSWEYVESGPVQWRIRIGRIAAAA